MHTPSTRSLRRVRFLAVAQVVLVLASLGVPLSAMAADGDGTVTVSPTSVVAGSTGNTLTFVHTVGASWASGTVASHLRITVPGGGWSAPTTAPGAGQVTISSDTCPGGALTLTASGSNIEVSGNNNQCNSGDTVTITYSATAGTTVGANTFTSLTRTNGSSGTLTTIASSPVVTVNAAVKVNTTTTITSDTPDPSIVGAGYTVNTSVTRASGGTTITGSVIVSDGTDSCTDPTPSGGAAATVTYSCSITSTTSGVKTLTATYSGDASFNGSAGTTTHTVNGADGNGTVAMHWDPVGGFSYADPTVTPGMSLELLDFNFTATAAMAAGSQVTITIPAGWTPPTIADSPGVLAINPTTPALTTPTCTLPTAGTPQTSVSGSGPWTITIGVTCAAGGTFRLRWGNTLANVITAPAAGTYEFTTRSAGPGGTLTPIAVQPTLTVVKLTQAALVLTGTSSPATFGSTQALGTTGGSGTGAVSYTSTTPAVCTISGSTLSIISGTGTCSVYATKAADANYNSATSATVNITAQKANQAPLFVTGTSSPAGYGSTQTLGTAGGSGTGGVTYSTGASTACSVSGNTLTITASSGTCLVTATKAADTNYNATSSASVAITVAKAVLTVTPDAQSRTFGQAVPAYTFSVTGFAPGENAGNAAGYVAPTCTSTYTTSTPVASSPLTITCSGGSATNYTFDTTPTAQLTIGKANPVCSISGVSVTYDGLGHGATGLCLGVNGETLAGLDLGDTFTNVPGGTADWTFTDVTGNYTDDAGSVAITIAQADPVCTISGFTGTYDGAAHGATGECLGVLGETLAGLDLGSSFTNVPGGTADWTLTNLNYTTTSGSVAIEIGKADPACTASGVSVTYDGLAHGATGECLGVLGETLAGLDLGSSFTNVPGGTADWTFTDVTGNYADAAGSVAITIGKADADCAVSGVSVTYDGDPHGATGECLGVLGETLAGLDLGASFTAVPGGTADWTFTDVTGNYTDDAGSVAIEIGKADADCSVSGYSGTYDGFGHGATGLCLGVNGETLAGLDLGDTFTNVPGGTADWTFTDVTGNYTDDAGSVAITISKADADCTVNGYSGTYDGDPHGATGECLGVLGETLAGLDLGSSFTNVPGGTADWTLDNANYNPVSGSVDIEITRADAVCSVSGVTVTYDGDPHGATGSCLGVNDEIISGLDRGDSFTDVPGGTAEWTLVNPNYNTASGSVTITITQAPQAIVFPTIPNTTFGVPSFELAATTDSGLPITYTSLTPSVCSVSGSTVTIVGVGTCAIEASQPGDGNVLAAQSVVRTFAVAAADDTTPETSTRSPLAVIAGDGPLQRTMLIGLIAVGILAATIVLLGYRAGRYGPRRGVRS